MLPHRRRQRCYFVTMGNVAGSPALPPSASPLLPQLLINLVAHWFWPFWRDGWSVFDFIIVLVSLISLNFDDVPGLRSASHGMRPAAPPRLVALRLARSPRAPLVP